MLIYLLLKMFDLGISWFASSLRVGFTSVRRETNSYLLFFEFVFIIEKSQKRRG